MRVDPAFNRYLRGSTANGPGAAAGRGRGAEAGAGSAPGPARGGESANTSAPRRLEEMSAEERRLIQELRNRDHQVRAHELAHQSAGGRYAGGVQFSFTYGPDGRRYATSGEVDVDLRRTGDPAEDLRTAETVRRAALAPAEPSAQDQRVAARAAALAAEAQAALGDAEAVSAASGADAAGGDRRTGRRRVEGEYIDRISIRRDPPAGPGQSPFAGRFAAVQRMGAPELMAVGGRLDLFA